MAVQRCMFIYLLSWSVLHSGFDLAPHHKMKERRNPKKRHKAECAGLFGLIPKTYITWSLSTLEHRALHSLHGACTSFEGTKLHDMQMQLKKNREHF